jgi:hypothetical protein
MAQSSESGFENDKHTEAPAMLTGVGNTGRAGTFNCVAETGPQLANETCHR